MFTWGSLLYKVPGAIIHKGRLIVSYENVIKHIQVNTASLIYIYKLICSCCASLWTMLTRSIFPMSVPPWTLYIYMFYMPFSSSLSTRSSLPLVWDLPKSWGENWTRGFRIRHDGAVCLHFLSLHGPLYLLEPLLALPLVVVCEGLALLREGS